MVSIVIGSIVLSSVSKMLKMGSSFRWVSLLSFQDVFFRICLGYNWLIKEKVEFKRGEHVLEEVEKLLSLLKR